MPARKRPTPEYTVTARQTLLGGLARDADIVELPSEVAPLHPRGYTFPSEVFLHIAVDALDWCGARRAGPLPMAGTPRAVPAPEHSALRRHRPKEKADGR